MIGNWFNGPTATRPVARLSTQVPGNDQDNADKPAPNSFQHPPWTVGLVLVAGVITLLFGILVNPIWLIVGSPFVIVLVLWLYIRLVVRPDETL